ncbi:hypothetical protein J437_LFUL005836 [Ladona fulva]|uniref:Uncharacterized protein n=1 Tax=Ladona fulva TaxID=123851 RepID=A0A8K0P778_LADFU|nr:hypothetical protein J437_LFUL005836 [Ladona fulva]
MKKSVTEGEYVVVCDFSENYAFVVQDEAPGFHWNNNQETVHLFVIYGIQEGKVTCKSFVCISECVKDDTVAVHLFQNSDGAPTHYKNLKNFINICHHEEDFHIPAEWHFFATAQGKGPCDGVGGTLKRLATRASLQHLREDHILTAK